MYTTLEASEYCLVFHARGWITSTHRMMENLSLRIVSPLYGVPVNSFARSIGIVSLLAARAAR